MFDDDSKINETKIKPTDSVSQSVSESRLPILKTEAQEKSETSLDISSVQGLVFWAGKKMLSIPNGPNVRGFRGSSWPAYPSTQETSWGQQSLRPGMVSPEDIDLMNSIFDLFVEIKNPFDRKILQIRCLVHPFSGKHIYSWNKLSRTLSIPKQELLNSFDRALEQLSKNPKAFALFRKLQPKLEA